MISSIFPLFLLLLSCISPTFATRVYTDYIVHPEADYPVWYYSRQADIDLGSANNDRHQHVDGYWRMTCDQGNILWPYSCNKNHEINECRGGSINEYGCEWGHPYYEITSNHGSNDHSDEFKCKSYKCGFLNSKTCYLWGPDCYECGAGFVQKEGVVKNDCAYDSYCGRANARSSSPVNTNNKYKYCAPCAMGKTSLGNSVQCVDCSSANGYEGYYTYTQETVGGVAKVYLIYGGRCRKCLKGTYLDINTKRCVSSTDFDNNNVHYKSADHGATSSTIKECGVGEVVEGLWLCQLKGSSHFIRINSYDISSTRSVSVGPSANCFVGTSDFFENEPYSIFKKPIFYATGCKKCEGKAK